MDYLDVIHGGDRMMDIIRTAEARLVPPGPRPFVEGRDAVRLSVAAVPTTATNPGRRRKPWRR